MENFLFKQKSIRRLYQTFIQFLFSIYEIGFITRKQINEKLDSRRLFLSKRGQQKGRKMNSTTETDRLVERRNKIFPSSA